MGKKLIVVRAKDRGYDTSWKTCEDYQKGLQKYLGDDYLVIVSPFNIYSPDGSSPMMIIDDITYSYETVINKIRDIEELQHDKDSVNEIKIGSYKKLTSNIYNLLIKSYAKECGIDETLFDNLNFIESLNAVSELIYDCKTLNDINNIKKMIVHLKYIINEYMPFMNLEFIIDSIESNLFYERVKMCQNPYEESEDCLKNKIINNFDHYFPDYDFIKSEYRLDDGTRIDILAKDKNTNRDVIIELKAFHKKSNVNFQLLYYGTFFKNPILIGVNHKGKKLKNIKYIEIE